MVSLAVSDLLLCFFGLWCCLLYISPFRNSGISFRTEDIFILTGGITRLFLARTSALITTYIAVERCLCVIFPLKVKTFITRTRTTIAMVTIYAFTVCPSFFVYFNYRFTWRFYPDVNRTLLGVTYVYSEVNNVVDKVVLLLCGTIFVFVSFAVTVICTFYLIIYMSRASKWRLKSAASTTVAADKSNNLPDGTGKKNDESDRAVRTVVAIASVFIICFSFGFAAMTLYVTLPGYTLYGMYGQMFQLFQSLGLFFGTVNSSINFFIYYFLGSSFRIMFHQVFGKKRKYKN
ncbi:chemosensory receptor A [Elysia marginata]|uniref:Chemosensory receptor A n=1 Tax=Elysia marginata TaxID=1093978 RepID=A0AAV4HMN4_9GAST|nr:chemosensory receptor A [Elysia marginata]